MNKQYHIPVMLDEILELMPTGEKKICIDCTLGTGGHSLAMLTKLTNSILVGVDLDEDQIDVVADKAMDAGMKADDEQFEKEWGWRFTDDNQNTFYIIKKNFAFLSDICKIVNIARADFVLFDLGFSSYQLDWSKRGFSYTNTDELLDQRYDCGQGWKAADIVNSLTKKELENILEDYGEEKYAKQIAREIVQAREVEPIETNSNLISIIRKAVGKRYERGKHPAMRTFQALRVATNNELVSLASALPQAFDLIAGAKESQTTQEVAGKVAVICFNSLEKRVLSQFLETNKNAIVEAQLRPGLSEVAKNPRSHSAEMYVITKKV